MNKNKKPIRVRFAPSPTGYLHIGGARTALYNWLFARKNNGVFILRIEDTDEVRSTEESVGGIIDSLEWLGLDWDEGIGKGGYGPYFQMQRFEKGIYQKYAEQLLKKGKAYYCYCTPEKLDKMSEEQILQRRPPGYDDRCRELTEEQRKKLEQEGRHPVIRFKMPKEGKTEFNDIIRGSVSFENALLDDFVMIKANGIPTYNYVCVIDDHLMEITHVIRGDDHLSNTPKQIQLYNASGWTPPEFAHLSMILGPDGSRLSKRHGATSVLEYKKMGYLPETLFNYLALLGWSTEDSQQLFDREELINEFSLKRCSKSSAKFDTTKLLWMNGEYIRKKNIDELYRTANEGGFLESDDIKNASEDYVRKTIELEHDKIKLQSKIPDFIGFFLKDNIEYNQEAVDKVLTKPDVKQMLIDIKSSLEGLDEFNIENLEKSLRDYAKGKNIKTSKVFHPVRVAVSGKITGPGLFEMLEFLGKEKVIKRIDYTVKKILL